MGDAQAEVEQELLAAHAALRADVLKLGHHGSHSSTTDEFLDAVQPLYGVLSAGNHNRYGHPHHEILEKFEARNIPLFRTDQDGTIIFLSDGEKITPRDR